MILDETSDPPGCPTAAPLEQWQPRQARQNGRERRGARSANPSLVDVTLCALEVFRSRHAPLGNLTARVTAAVEARAQGTPGKKDGGRSTLTSSRTAQENGGGGAPKTYEQKEGFSSWGPWGGHGMNGTEHGGSKRNSGIVSLENDITAS